MLKVTTQELKESFEYFESIPVSESILMIITDINANTRHNIYQYIIRYVLLGKRYYCRGFGSLEDINAKIIEIDNKISVWLGDF